MTPSKLVILSLGEVLWDLFAEGARLGGAPANFACHAAAVGAEVSLVSAVGDDARGREAKKILQAYEIDVTLLQTIGDAPTGTVGICLNAQGKPTFTIHGPSAWDQVDWTTELASRITRAGAVYFGTLGQRGAVSRKTIRRALNLAKATGVRRVLDVNLRPPFFDAALIRDSVAWASILKLSDDELGEVGAACEVDAARDPEERLRALLERYRLDLVVMTRGANGALLVSADETIDEPGIPTTVRDTVGAGDAFTAALVAGLHRDESLSAIARDACQRAAAVCAQSGAVPELPGLS